ncbi:MAG: F0F1 ATP synthase subunit alpha [Candidatus Omnitrophota bacterium]
MLQIKEVGKVAEVKKSIARIEGLSMIMNGQLVSFAGNLPGIIIGFSGREAMVLILGDESGVRIGQEVYTKSGEFRIPVGRGYPGRIVNALAEPMDGQGDVLPHDGDYPVFCEASGTMDRKGVDSCLETGIKVVDAFVPVARGQRQLIVGDRMTGKTTIAVDTILNQKDKDVVCVYCCVGKTMSFLEKTVRLFKQKQALGYTITVAATAAMTAGEQYLAPYTAATLGEYFMHQGRDVLVVFDDLTKHAWAYRQISLLLERPPGREAYPGDIYYLHSQLMERAGQMQGSAPGRQRGGSMTFLPIVDTLQEDLSGFIPSNLISIVDGQVYLSSASFSEGIKPAVDLFISVSIIGSKVQHPILREMVGVLRREYRDYRQLLRLTSIKATLNQEAEKKVLRGRATVSLLAQNKNSPIDICELIILFYALKKGILDELSASEIDFFAHSVCVYLGKTPGVRELILEAVKLDPEIGNELDKCLDSCYGALRRI